MATTVDLSFQYTEDEFVSAVRAYMMRSPGLIIPFVCGLLLLFLAALLLAFEIDSFFLYICTFGGVLLLSVEGFLFFSGPRWRFRSEPKIRNQFFLQFSEDGLLFKSSQIESKVQWQLYTRFIESRQSYLLIYGENMYSIIPKRAFSDAGQEAAFRSLLSRKIAPAHHSHALEKSTAQELEREYVPPSEPPDWR
jgi:hypothetical protein